MFSNLHFALSSVSPIGAERAELAALYPVADERWNQKFDRLRCLVTVRDAGQLVAAGIVHDSVLAPTSAMDALELGSMVVRSDYRRLGIRQHVTSLRLEYALRAEGTPITVIHASNPASWAYYERSENWERERSYDFNGATMFLYRATEQAKLWAAQLPAPGPFDTARQLLLSPASEPLAPVNAARFATPASADVTGQSSLKSIQA